MLTSRVGNGEEMIRYEVLGPLKVHRDEHDILIGAAMLRRLLAWLLLRDGRPVRAGELAEILWYGSPPATSRKALQVYVGRLRRLLADPDAIRHVSGGYTLSLEAAEVDTARFEKLIEVGAAARRQGDLTSADGALTAALALWRGTPYADLVDTTLSAEEIRRLEERHLNARMEHVAVRLDQRRHDEIIAELIPAVRANPFHERLIGYQMMALYRADRQAEALEVFRQARQQLTEELGVAPGPALSRLHHAILRNDDRLARLDIAQIERGLESETVPVTAGSPPPATAVPAQLPADVRGFAGRDSELSILDGWLTPPGPDRHAPMIVVHSGSAGVGKTALSVHWAHRVVERFPDGQLYVNLRGFDDSGAVVGPMAAVRQFLDALGVPPQRIPADPDAQVNLYRTLLAGKRILVVLDNARDPEQVRPLLPGASDCVVLITSRNLLTGLIAAEGARHLALDVLTPDEARDLLARRLGDDRVTAEPHAVDDIISACARLPIALAIVAARAEIAADLPLAVLAGQLRTGGDRLDTLSTGDDPRTDLRAVFSWSYHALTPDAAKLFRLLGLHPGPDVSAPVAASLAGIAPAAVRPLLAELTRASLLAEPTAGRYTFHDLLRDYATQLAHRINTGEQRHAAIGRILDHYLHTAHDDAWLLYPTRDRLPLAPPRPGVTPEPLGDHTQALDWFTVEHRALLAAIAHAAATGFDTHTWQLALTLAAFLDRRGHWHDWMAIAQTAVAATARLADPAAQTDAHRNLAGAYMRLGRLDDAHIQLSIALDLATRAGDHTRQALAHLRLAYLWERRDSPTQALHHAEQGLHLYQATGHKVGQARTLNTVGWYHALLGNHQQALAHCRQALTLLQQVGDRLGQAATWDSLGYAHHHLVQRTQAIACYQHALTLYRDLGARYEEATTLTNLGHTHHAAGDTQAACIAWRQALSTLNELDHADAEKVRATLAGLGEDAKA